MHMKKYGIILSLVVFVCGCAPVIYMDVGQSPDGRYKIRKVITQFYSQ